VSNKIYLEEKSLDTISNAVFSKEIVDRHKDWKNIFLLTSDYHMKRSLWLFKKIFDKPFHVYPFPIVSKFEEAGRKKYEDFLLTISKKIVKDILSNNQSITKMLRKVHPFYSHSKPAKELLKKIVDKRKELIF
jgi:uncharacterized SAM-binding protein YcdF (DUF218 family)